MKIYFYELRDLFINKPESMFITCSELEAEEKTKTYMVKSHWLSRLNKSNIGCVAKFCGIYVYLLEKDEEKAKKLFRNYLSKSFDEEKKRHEEECNEINRLLSVCQSE